MIIILAFLVALFASTQAFAQAEVVVDCFNPSGGAGQQRQPCQYGNAAPVANLLQGTGNGTSTSAYTIIAAQAAGIKIYVTGLQCGRTDAGTTAIFATLNDSAATIVVLPNSGGGGGNNMVFQTPLVVAAATAFTFTPSSGVSTAYCNAQGYQGK